MTETTTYYYKNDMIIEVNGLKNAISGAYVNDATVTVTMVDSAGSSVVGETWPLSVGYVGGTDGIYRATLQDSLTLTVGNLYTAKVTAVGGGYQAYWETPLMVTYRR